MTPTLRERIAGGLLGLAVGDALGSTVEFLTPEQIQTRHGIHRDIVGGGTFGWRPGQGTDDTDLTWAVLAAYLGQVDTREVDSIQPVHRHPRSITGAVAANMLAWRRSGPRDIGGTTSQALTKLARDGDSTHSGCRGPRSAGNGSLMRCLPTALARPELPARVVETAFICAITHAKRRCIDACWAYNEVAAALLEGAAATAAIAAALEFADIWHPEVTDALRIDAQTPLVELDTSGYVIASLGCAVWGIQQPEPLEEVLVALVNRGDDADTTGAIAGGLLGLRDGVSAIPARWVERLEYRDRMLAAVDALVEIRGGRSLEGEARDRADTAGGDSPPLPPEWLSPPAPPPEDR